MLLLAHLFRSMIAGRALEVVRSSPPAFDRNDFSELLAFVADMLPLRYASSCHKFVPPADGEAMPEKGQANLLVLDAERAVPTDREVQQVDEDGELLVGDEPEQPFLDYAEAAIAGALVRPDALASFSLRFDRLLGDGMPGADTPAMAATVYALSALFTAPTVGTPGMFRQHMLPLASNPELPWSNLVADSEWKLLNAGDLSAWILTPPQRLSVGERTLQEALVRGLERAGWQLDDPSPPWRRPTETDWWERLWELLAIVPRLLPTSLAADLARGVSLDEVPAVDLVPLLEAEFAGATLWRRRWQADGLAGACTEPGVFPVLLAALEQGELDALWLERLLTMDGPWIHSGFRRDLQSVLLERLADIPPVPEWLPRVEQGLAGVELPAAPDIITKDRYADVYRLVCLLIDHGLERSADLIAGGTDLLHRCRVLHRVLRALDENASDDPAWKDLAKLCGKASSGTGGNKLHPLTELAAMLGNQETDGIEKARYQALEVLKGVLVENPLLLYPISGNQDLRVPLFDLVIALSGAETRARIPDLLSESICRNWVKKPEWRQAVIDTLRDPDAPPPSKLSDPDRELVIRDLETHWRDLHG
ncbi:MAG: hypothetical protein LGR52_00975 [Candidatus Thiosymbion ectosymbiont of Robbea hypermnestra]|nr:hypothetical protein [Candidatus Thiosymbion ectosymbiont of Robbea hypermnestra]